MFISALYLIKNDFFGDVYNMERICKIHTKDYCTVPENEKWVNKAEHEINRLYYIDSGKGWYLEDGIIHPFEAGKLYFIPYYAGISTYTDNSDRLVHAFVNFKLSPPIVSKKVFCLDPSSSPRLESALFSFREFCKKSYNIRRVSGELAEKDKRELQLLGALTLYLTESAVVMHSDYVLNDPAIVSALNVIHTTLGKNLTVANIAQKCCMSTDGFSRKFTRFLGITPYAYIKNLRVRTAIMMRNEGATLEEAAEKCGYSDAAALLHAITAKKRDKTPLPH